MTITTAKPCAKQHVDSSCLHARPRRSEYKKKSAAVRRARPAARSRTAVSSSCAKTHPLISESSRRNGYFKRQSFTLIKRAYLRLRVNVASAAQCAHWVRRDCATGDTHTDGRRDRLHSPAACRFASPEFRPEKRKSTPCLLATPCFRFVIVQMRKSDGLLAA